MCCMLLRRLCDLPTGRGFTKFALPQGKFCFHYDSVGVIFFGLIAVLGGILGAAFNQIVEYLNHLRVEHINKSALRRVLEVVLFATHRIICCPTTDGMALHKCRHR